MSYQALSNFLILKPLKAVQQSAGGIMLPDKSKNQFSDFAVVVSVGPEVSQDLCVGNTVVRPDPARYELTNDDTGEILLVVEEDDVMVRVVQDA